MSCQSSLSSLHYHYHRSSSVARTLCQDYQLVVLLVVIHIFLAEVVTFLLMLSIVIVVVEKEKKKLPSLSVVIVLSLIAVSRVDALMMIAVKMSQLRNADQMIAQKKPKRPSMAVMKMTILSNHSVP